MIILLAQGEIRRFETIDKLATYLGQVASAEYAEEVLTWAGDASNNQPLSINNGPKDVDYWYKRK